MGCAGSKSTATVPQASTSPAKNGATATKAAKNAGGNEKPTQKAPENNKETDKTETGIEVNFKGRLNRDEGTGDKRDEVKGLKNGMMVKRPVCKKAVKMSDNVNVV